MRPGPAPNAAWRQFLNAGRSDAAIDVIGCIGFIGSCRLSLAHHLTRVSQARPAHVDFALLDHLDGANCYGELGPWMFQAQLELERGQMHRSFHSWGLFPCAEAQSSQHLSAMEWILKPLSHDH